MRVLIKYTTTYVISRIDIEGGSTYYHRHARKLHTNRINGVGLIVLNPLHCSLSPEVQAMSIDGAHAQNSVENAANHAFDTIKEGIRNNNLADVVNGLDRDISGSNLSGQEKLEVSKSLGSKLQESGLLPRVLVDYSSKSFGTMSNGDNYIHSNDLDGALQAGIESNLPVRGLITRGLRSNMSSIALSHEDASSFRDERPSDSEEIGKGISKKDLSEWGQDKNKGSFHTEMSAKMMRFFGNSSTWSSLAGSDNLLSGDELDKARVDTVRYNSEQRNALNYMDKNFGGIRASASGDSNFKMSLSDVVNWSGKHGVSADIAESPVRHEVEARISPADKVGGNVDLGLRSIRAGLQDGDLTGNLRQFDDHLVKSGLSPQEINEIRTGVSRGLSSDSLLRRTMGQYALENFDTLKGDNRYINQSDLDSFLQSDRAKDHPVESMLMANLRHNSDTIAMAHQDNHFNNDYDADDREKRLGISKDDALAMLNEDVSDKQKIDMSRNMMKFFSSTEDFNKLSQGDGQISKDDLDQAKTDTFRFSPEERSTASFMRENYGSIKASAEGDGGKITLSDIINYSGKHGITRETMEMEASRDHQRRQPMNGHVEQREQYIPPRRDDVVVRNDQPVIHRDAEAAPQRREQSIQHAQQVQHERPLERHSNLGDAGDATKVTLQNGDRLWNMAIQKYGTPAIEAIFEANGMQPSVVNENGKPTILDPSYGAGKEIILPSAQDIPRLTEQYRARAEQLREQNASRAGEANEATEVRLMYGDTLSSLAMKKYGHAVPIEALYAANNLPPRFEQDANGCVIAREPIYYAGRKYVLPPADQIQALARAYEQKYFRR